MDEKTDSDHTRGQRSFRLESLEPRNLLAGDVAISEINYNPHDPTADELLEIGDLNNDDFEFIEIQNIGDSTLDLQGASFTQGFNFTFGNVSLTPGEYGVVIKQTSGFRVRYTDPNIRVLGEYESGGLNNGGERIKLENAAGEELLDFDYSDGSLWPQTADGFGATLELIDAQATTDKEYEKYYSWRGSSEVGGSPGSAGAGPVGVVINEVLTHTDAPITPPDSIELLNTTAEPIDISGWYLSDNPDDLLKFQIPADTVLDGGDYIVFDETDFNPTPDNPGPNDFRLDAALGDFVWLVGTDADGELDLFVDDVQFGAAQNSESFGRPNGTGRLTPLSRLSLGCENAYPRVGPVIVSEVNYDPGAPSLEALAILPTIGSGDLEFVEIHNPTGQTVNMTEWRIRGGFDYDFAENVMLSSQETWVFVTFDPDDPANATLLSAFRTHYGMNGGETLIGPNDPLDPPSLSNSSERIQLQWPDEPPTDAPDVIPRLSQDEVLYDDLAPWPMTADGLGDSLQRKAPVFYGNDAGSWKAEAPSPGSIDFSGNVEGDFNNDGQLTADDIDILFDAANSPNAAIYLDYDGSFSVNPGDVTVFLQSVVGARFGDANLDGVVDASDFNIWNDNKFQSCNKSWADGDFNGDAVVDAADFNIWSINKFTSAAAPAAAAGGIPRAADAAGRQDHQDVVAAVPSQVAQRIFMRRIAMQSMDVSPAPQDTVPTARPTTLVDQFFAAFESRQSRRHQRSPLRGNSAATAIDDGESLNPFSDRLSFTEGHRQDEFGGGIRSRQDF
jgi:hypothetical protein